MTVTTPNEPMTSVTALREWAERGHLYAILDATDTPSVPVRAQALGEERAVSLYRGQAEEALSSIAPYLVQVDASTLDWIASELWAEPWGVFVMASQTLEQLRTHFRHFLLVESPEGEQWYFRFYDPRVLPQYCATCTPAERKEFYGPVLAYGVTDVATYGVRLMPREGVTYRQSRA